jgi:hypothetical protein
MNEKPKEKNTKQILDREHYLRNREQKIVAAKKRYRKIKGIQEKELKKRVNKYSQVENYKVLMSFKDYSILTPEKKRKWLDFDWTLKDLSEVGVHNISEVMRLRELADILISDYWKTAKKEQWKGKLWNSLDSKKQQQLIKFWARELVREEMAINEGLEEIDRKGEEREKEIEMAKFHEERGKVKCQCWQCSANKPQEEEKTEGKEQCPDCGKWVKKLDSEEGICKNCLASYQ